MTDFNFADGSVAVVVKDGSPVTLIKGYQDNTWFYAPRAARIARDGRDRPIFTIVRSRRRLPSGQGLVTAGGTFAAQLDLTIPILTEQDKKELTEFIILASGLRPDTGTSFNFQPLQLREGRMSILGVDSYVKKPEAIAGIKVGASSSLGVSLDLTGSSDGIPGGADVFYSALRNSNSSVILPLLVSLTYEYDMILPNCHYLLKANNKLIYDFFSGSYKDKFSYYGLVGGQSDLSFTRSELLKNGAITITQISRPDSLNDERIKQLEASLIDVFTKTVLAQIADKPKIEPASAPNPKGYFGGVSLQLKSYSEIQGLDLSAEYNFSEIVKVPYSMSYVFGPQFSQLDPLDYVLDITTDNQLPITINIGGDPRVLKYSGQYGYRREDGVFIANSISDLAGEKGGVLTGVVQFGTNEPKPQKVEVQYTVDWANPDWEDRKEVEELPVGDGGASTIWSPGVRMGKVQVANDFERYEESTFASISWQTSFDDSTAKIYSGGSFVLGQGPSGRLQIETIDFPYVGDQSKALLVFDITVQKPDGLTLNKRIEAPITTSRILLSRAMMAQSGPAPVFNLIPGEDDAVIIAQQFTTLDEWLKCFGSYADLRVNNYQKHLYSTHIRTGPNS
jgi:hypothetical protein